jgi:N-acetylglutamate synthase-like GNAT family acetyltransferase
MPTFLFFGRLDNGRAVVMNVKSYRWFNRGGYTTTQIDKLRAAAQELLDTNEHYESCGEVTVHEVVGTTNPEVKRARVVR